MKRFQDYVAAYRSTAEENDRVWREFTEATDTIDWLREHRDWVARNNWGLGDRAFHFMWYLLLKDAIVPVAEHPALLEIGVFKGQVISLWALIASRCGATPRMVGISPLVGNPAYPRGLHFLMLRVSKRYREDAAVGNLFPHDDYEGSIRRIFQEFGQDFGFMRLLCGSSQDVAIRAQIEGERFDVVYIDGGHRYDQVSQDITSYGPRVKPGGYLVLDDASWFQPGSAFFKGFESVSRAAEELDAGVFRNVLNVGHNRIYQRRIS
jgi:hypothetical protein